MLKRVAAALLWFYAGWYLGALLAHFLGVSPVLGPLVGAAAAALFAGDPRHLIWTRSTSVSSATETPPNSAIAAESQAEPA